MPDPEGSFLAHVFGFTLRDASRLSAKEPSAMPPPDLTIHSLLSAILTTQSTLHLQLLNLQAALLQPQLPPPPPSPSNTLLVPGGATPSIIDSNSNTWTISPHSLSETPVLHLNGHPDLFTGPTSLALYLDNTLYFQRLTGQWHSWSPSNDHWLPSTDPRTPSSPEWGPPALRASEGAQLNWLPSPFPVPASVASINYDLLTDLFADNHHSSTTFLPSPIPITIRPSRTPRPLVFQRSDSTFLIPIFSTPTPITLQFPGLRPSHISLYDLLSPSTSPIRVSTGTDTISVPSSKSTFHLIELSLS